MIHLHNHQLRERHWAAIDDLLGRRVDRTPDAATSIATLLDLQVGHLFDTVLICW